jgi:hypothetical protein
MHATLGNAGLTEMDAQKGSDSVLNGILDSPVVKGLLAAITVGAMIMSYIKEAGERLAHAAVIAKRYDLKNPVFFFVNRLPHILHSIVAYGALIAAGIELLFLIDQDVASGSIFQSAPQWLIGALQFLSKHFVVIFFIGLILFVLFELRAIENLLAWLLGLFPRVRRSLGWANAKWQITRQESERGILAPSQRQLEATANRLLAQIVDSARGNSLALRPATLADESAANTLYFGHVIEAYFAQNYNKSFPWTVFYEALACVAEANGRPLSPNSIKRFNGLNGFLPILLPANQHLPATDQIENVAGLEEEVEAAFKTLREKFDGDALNCARGVIGTDYSRVLRRSKAFLKSESMRRQFAKLFIVWGVKKGATHPEFFRVPFSTRILVKYLDDGVVLREGGRFNTSSELVEICFDAIQHRVQQRAYELLERSKDPGRQAWRESERQDINTRKLAWKWWIYYLIDVQAYHESRRYVSSEWKREGQEIVKEK